MLVQQRSWTIAFLQGLLVLCSLALAWTLRFEFSFPNPSVVLAAAPILLLLRLAAMARFGLFHGYWRYTGVRDAEDILKAMAWSTMGFIVTVRCVPQSSRFPLSVCVLEAGISVFLLSGVRLFCRRRMQRGPHARRGDQGDSAARVLVVGAGSAAEMLIRELPHHGYAAIGCVDDDPAKRRAKVHGVPVLGRIDDVPAISGKYQIDELMIALPSVGGARMRRIIEICQRSQRKFKIIPGLRDLIEGKVMVGQLREVQLEDLLGRDPVQLDLERVRRDLEGKVVMVTGAAGSIGSELCGQILEYAPAKLICLDQAETPLFHLERALAETRFGSRIVCCMADINDCSRMRTILRRYGVEIIFHAAAYKHVPMMEANLQEALKNNVFALLSLLDVAQESRCSGFVLISSDKAVHPTSFMGCTKRLGELIVAARPVSSMRCVSVRFGNVLGSQGSVVPIFQEQIRATQTITVTHPRITRYFMTIPEAVSLVLEAYTIGRHGDVLVLDMGKPIRILDLAKTLIRLSGKSEDEIGIRFTGLRPGEKLYEELFYAQEARLSTPSPKVLRARAELLSWSALRDHLQDLYFLMGVSSDARIRQKVKEIIPEYQYSRERLPAAEVPARSLFPQVFPTPSPSGLAGNPVASPKLMGSSEGLVPTTLKLD